MVEGSDTQVSVTRPLPVDSSERRAPILTRCGIAKHVISLYLPGLKSGVSREVLMSKFKFCKDCRFHHKSIGMLLDFRMDHYCKHESSMQDDGNLIVGSKPQYRSCSYNRYSGKCGRDGQYYERGGIINFFKSLFGWKKT